MKYDVVALGELLFDCVMQKKMMVAETNTMNEEKAMNEAKAMTGFHFICHPGGAPANFLACLSKMERKTAFLGKVGMDMFGQELLHTLQSLHIATEGLILDSNFFTTLAFVQLDKNGERSFSFARKPGADTMLFPEEINPDFLYQTQFFHFGSLSLTDEPCRSTTKATVKLASEISCLISYDPNLRPALWKNMDQARNEILWGLDQCHWLKISLEECEFLWPKWKGKDYISKLFEYENIDMILLTKGKDGASIATRKQRAEIQAPSVLPVDTTGAGDICGGAALSRFLEIKSMENSRLLRSDIQNLSANEVRSIGQFAVVAGSLSTEFHGAIPSIPDKNNIQNFLSLTQAEK